MLWCAGPIRPPAGIRPTPKRGDYQVGDGDVIDQSGCPGPDLGDADLAFALTTDDACGVCSSR
jgi:hypothetical protein